MKILLLIIIIFTVLITNIYSTDKYASINPALYHYLEYKLLKKSDEKIFVLTQPYKLSDVKRVLKIEKGSGNLSILYGIDPSDSLKYLFKMRFAPGYNYISNNNQDISDNNVYFNSETVLALNKFLFVNNIRMDRFVKYDPDFHGDTGESGMGYIDEAYGIYESNGTEIFGGRIARNWGPINEFGLILSNNPYAYDHFGFSTEFKQLKYSYYFTRLNNMMGRDFEGVVIPQDTLVNVKRFWSIQRLDYKFSKDLQFGFTEAVVYGGPNQNFSAAYLSPFNIYYVSQRNQLVQMSFYLDANMYYKPIDNFAFYFDFFMDDLTINNEEGIDDRADHPDRLGLMTKLSYTSDILSFIEKTLLSLTYVRIWNDSYTTYRDFENYIYYNKSMGYPFNAHEAVKLDISNFDYVSNGFIPILKLEWSRQGDRTVLNLYDGEKDNFPVGPDVTYKFSTDLGLNIFKWNFELNLNAKYDFYSLNSDKVFSDEKELTLKILLKYNLIVDLLR